MKRLMTGAAFGLLFLSGLSFSAVSPEQAAQLGKTLTPLGAEKAGNKDGTIPAWTGGLARNTGKVVDGYVENPYAAEKPLFVIDAKNVDKYKDKLSPGQVGMLKRYPDTYRLPVYTTHRSAAVPDTIYKTAAENALTAKVVDVGLVDFKVAYPFPMPQTALEVMWNHITRYRGPIQRYNSIQVTPEKNGDFIPVNFYREFGYRDQVKALQTPDTDNVFYFFKSVVTTPARLAGNVLLVHETLNQVQNPRLAWMYSGGQRRVRRAPQVAYDSPYTGAEGQRVSDNGDMFNGAMDRYDWKLVGKREMYIPYNAYSLMSPKLKYTDIVRPGHINPDLTRYELHRVWEVEATLRPGERHIYAKRSYFIDEDTWQIVLADHYDGRGTLWRVGKGHLTELYDQQIPWLAVETLYDLLNGRYIASGMKNEDHNPMVFGGEAVSSEFTPSALRSTGIR
ncbi:uncharacterized protein DUF1329 [Pseudomonas baetica]|uniref:Uncharacterized protein DUF1329 n=1 Tax=Pseudomonas baetica TaxID=674054 RepID=A0ABX4PT01_9PSED|nr:DUF1329 domain-containing protein [Pseudomonas baetica]PKA68162.1 uncharacterized protein DUF1329 [Pseudomonas baetica]PTC17965.1 DUF1329 domain-containing protein [Pseudomonas baetica]